METSYVLSGLARKVGLCLLSSPKVSVSCSREELFRVRSSPVANNNEQEETTEQFCNVNSHSEQSIDTVAKRRADFKSPSNDSPCVEKDDSISGSEPYGLACTSCSSEQDNYDCCKTPSVATTTSKVLTCTKELLPLKSNDRSDVENCAVSCFHSVVNKCNTSTVGREKDLLYQDKSTISDMKECETPGSCSRTSDCSNSTLGQYKSRTTRLHQDENISPVKKSTHYALNSVVNNCISPAVCNSSSEAVLLHQSRNLSGAKNCADPAVIGCTGSSISEAKSRITLPHPHKDHSIVKESGVSYLNSVVNNYSDTAVDKSSFEALSFHQNKNICNVENCIGPGVSDGSNSVVKESKSGTTLQHQTENLSDVSKCTVSGLNSEESKCRSLTVCESKSGATLTHEDEEFSDVNICGVSGVSNSGVSCLTSNLCDTRTLSKDNIQEFDDEDEYVCVTDDETDRPYSQNKWDTSDDLPLMANVDEVLVTHYVLNLSVNFNEKVMSGDITLFLKPATELVVQRQFQLCLDCSLVDIESVEEIDLKDDFTVKQYGATTDDSSTSYPADVFKVDKFKKVPVALPYTLLPYAVRNWCVRIWKPHKLGRTWPRCVRIKYCTRPEGKSLTWTTDQDSRYVELEL